MASWHGGPCPVCGEVMPERLVHCISCRALLNSDLIESSIPVPEFFELKEITEPEFKIRGYYVGCGSCSQELRINRKYLDTRVGCRQCGGIFDFKANDPTLWFKAVYGPCPHCQKEIRIATKYEGISVGCKHCEGKLMYQREIHELGR